MTEETSNTSEVDQSYTESPAAVVRKIQKTIADLSPTAVEKLIGAFREYGWQSINKADIDVNGYPPYPQLSEIQSFVQSLWATENQFDATPIDERTRKHLMARCSELKLGTKERHAVIWYATEGATKSSKELTDAQCMRVLEVLEQVADGEVVPLYGDDGQVAYGQKPKESGAETLSKDAVSPACAPAGDAPAPDSAPTIQYITLHYSDEVSVDLSPAELLHVLGHAGR